MSGGKMVSCAYCGTRITKRIIKGDTTVFNDSTGNRICPQRAGDTTEHSPTVVEGEPVT